MKLGTTSLRWPARRAFFTSPVSSSVSPAHDIHAWCDRLIARPPTYARDTLDSNRSLALHRTLPTRGRHGLVRRPCGGVGDGAESAWRSEPRLGEPLRKAWSLGYWWPRAELNELSEDGGVLDYNAPPPYMRRMWASGTFTWPSLTLSPTESRERPTPLLLGHTLVERTRVIKAELKKDMVFVHQERTVLQLRDVPPLGSDGAEGAKAGGNAGARDELQREIRVHVFRRAVPEGQAAVASSPKKPTYTPPSDPTLTLSYTPTPALLFRFSALTFNAHRIHYDEPWTRAFEGHPRVVVHGPLSALLLVELAAFHERGQGGESGALGRAEGGRLARVEYRATAPMYVGASIEMGCKWVDGDGPAQEMELWAMQGGRVGMTARAWFE